MNALARRTAFRKPAISLGWAAAMALLVLCAGQAAQPAFAATPAQVPLLTRSANAAEPNVMFTFDDSGSMAWRFMPDSATWSTTPSTRWRTTFHPRDTSVFGNSASGAMQVVATRPNRRTSAGNPICETDTQFADCRASDLISARMRSSAYNTLYYNPDIRYQPWYHSDGTPFPDADVRAAWTSPNNRVNVATVAQRTTAVNNGTAVRLVTEDASGNIVSGEVEVASNTTWCRSGRATGTGNGPNQTAPDDRNRSTGNTTCGSISSTSSPIYTGTFEVNSTTCPDFGGGWSWTNNACGRTANNQNNCTSVAGAAWGASGQNPRCRLELTNASRCSAVGGVWENSQCLKPLLLVVNAETCPSFGAGWSWTNNACGRTANNQNNCTSVAGAVWGASGQNPRCRLEPTNSSRCSAVGGSWNSSISQCLQVETASEEFTPAVYYHYHGGGTGEARNFSRVRVMDLPETGIARGTGRTDCSISGGGRACTRAQEYQNFANWFTYYRTRHYTAIAGASRAFSEQDESLRIGYGRINKSSSAVDGGTSTTTIERGVRRFTGDDRNAFFTWLHSAPASGGTPLRRAMDDIGTYYQRSDNRGPWGNTPGTNDGAPHLQCRKAYHILMSDGYWNGDAAGTSGARLNVDDTNGPVITGPSGNSYQYIASRPYRDGHANTLADVAMYYWNRDLRPDLPNRVPPDAKNPAFWQHMVNFTVGLGVDGTLSYPSALSGLQSGAVSWPEPGDDRQQNIDDLWHAALNSRGEYLSAKDPDEFANALSAILEEIIVRTASEGGVAAAASTLQAGNRKYVPEYRTAVWSGDLKAYELDAFGQQLEMLWSAATSLPPHGDRILYAGTRNGAPKAQEFRWDTLSEPLKEDLGLDATAALVDFIRGSDALEGSQHRDRPHPLGDFVNSQPVFIKGLVDLQYNQLPAGTSGRTTYRAFVNTKRERPGVVAIGGNAGMLHLFRDLDGREIFGFIPRVLLPGLAALASPSYGHRYYVDGQLTESDAYLGSAWKNVLVGSTGAGARAIFALDVTNTSTSMGAGNVMWELDSSIDAELGYVLTPIEVGLLKNGQWAAVFGNGYDSASGYAQLFVVNLESGAVIRRIQASSETGNGLGGVRVIRDANRVIVGAYAGDLKGKLWKFDLSSTSSAAWGVSFAGQPLFNAGATQPITAAPQFIIHPQGGQMVLVGTGKLFEEGDQTSTADQSLYGLWDQQRLVLTGEGETLAWSWSAGATRITDPDTIVQQGIDEDTITGGGEETYYTITSQPLNWSTHRGWQLPLSVVQGQRSVLSPQFIFGFALFETMAPSAEGVVNPCDTAAAGAAYNFLLNPLNGAMPAAPLFDTDGDGVLTADDQIVGGVFGTWDGRDVVLTQRPCLTADDCPIDPDNPNRCPPGTKLTSIQGAVSGNVNICVPITPPERWWWRQLQAIPVESP